MNIVYLRYAVAVAKAGSLNKAAEELFIAQPNLSRAIKELEKELGIVIFDRNSKGITLTHDRRNNPSEQKTDTSDDGRSRSGIFAPQIHGSGCSAGKYKA